MFLSKHNFSESSLDLRAGGVKGVKRYMDGTEPGCWFCVLWNVPLGINEGGSSDAFFKEGPDVIRVVAPIT
jgi:hypothetical protein